MRTATWKHLLEDEDFRRWYDNLARGSEVTAKERTRVLHRFLRRYDMSPRGLVEYAKGDRRGLEDLISDFITELHKEGKSPVYMANYLKADRSWLNYHEIRLVRRIKISKRDSTLPSSAR